MRVLNPRVAAIGRTVRVRVGLRANRRATARITLLVPPRTRTARSRGVAKRRVKLRAGRTVRPTIRIRRARLSSRRTIRISIVARDARGARLVINRIVELPRR